MRIVPGVVAETSRNIHHVACGPRILRDARHLDRGLQQRRMSHPPPVAHSFEGRVSELGELWK